MKIVLISPAHPLRGGIAASSERLALELQNTGHEVVLYSFSLQYPGFLFPGKSQFTDDPPPPRLVIKTRINSVNPINWIIAGLDVAREQPDCVIVRFWIPFMGPCLGTVLRIARWFSRKKMRFTALVDNIIPHEKRPGDQFFARYFVRACDDFVVMSRAVGEEIQQFLPAVSTPSPVRLDAVIPPALPFERGPGVVRFAPHPIYDTYGTPVEQADARLQLTLPAEAPIVLFFGFIRAYKGLDLLLDALAETPGVHALIAGECYENWQPYQAIIEKNNLAKRVHLHTDFIPTDQVRLFFSAADLVVQPYRSATQSGISQIAYHFDKPMVVTNVGGLPEIVTNGISGYVVAPEAGAIAGAIRDFFEKNRSAEMTAGVHAEKRRFSWENLVKVLLQG